jgi:beta-lactamase class A
MGGRKLKALLATLALGAGLLAPVHANADADGFESAFDIALGTELRAPPDYNPTYATPLEAHIGLLADGQNGRIGVAAIDLATGEQISILGDQRFPMASTSKIAVAATFLEGVDQGRWSLDDEFPLLLPVRSRRFSSPNAPLSEGEELPARELIELMITRSNNAATDALLHVVGGPEAVNEWVGRAGIEQFSIDRYIATLVRDDGEFDPAQHIDLRDSATPLAMAQLLKGLYEGEWLSESSREVLIGAMERCRTGTRRIPALMPDDVLVAHKTGSLNNTSSDIGIITLPDGRSIALAIYVTGQGTRVNREARIATIARGIYDGYATPEGQVWLNGEYTLQPAN